MILKGDVIQRFPDASRCHFCEFLSLKNDGNILNRPWHGAEDYSAIVSVGALVPGWSLICPNEHRTNLAEDYRSMSFWNFVAKTNERLLDAYDTPVSFFEHGPLVTGSVTGCGTDHAHMHAVPLNFSLEEVTYQFDPELKWQECRAADINKLCDNHEYLFMVTKLDGINTSGSIVILKTGVSQFFRKVIADSLGISEHYDYKTNPMLETATSTAERLHNYLPDNMKRNILRA